MEYRHIAQIMAENKLGIERLETLLDVYEMKQFDQFMMNAIEIAKNTPVLVETILGDVYNALSAVPRYTSDISGVLQVLYSGYYKKTLTGTQ